MARKNFIFFFGIVSLLAMLLLTGAADNNSIGKYQMEAFARGNTTHIYIIDTTTGKVKWLDEMDMPFEQMKAD